MQLILFQDYFITRF